MDHQAQIKIRRGRRRSGAKENFGDSFYSQRDYREILREEFTQRIEQNALYSLRAYARDLAISVSRLSEIFSGKNNLGLSSAQKICQRLGYSPSETEHFCDLVRYRKAKAEDRRILDIKLQSRCDMDRYRLSMDTFNVIAEWHHFAILELCEMKNFREDVSWIARRLDVNPNFIQAAIERMLRLGLLRRSPTGRLRASEGWTLSPSDVPSAALRQSHERLLARALKSLQSDPVEARDFSNVLMTFDPKNLPRAKEAIRDFRRGFKKKLPASSRCERLYSLAIQFFPLDKA